MKAMGLNEIRESYLSFFESKGHLRLKSHSLIPQNDKSLLLINSGMAPLKPYFTGQEIPPNRKVTTCQKCIRTGDIENVGKTARHGTFFEMLGNFSFADYFKREAMSWSLEFCTNVLKIPAEKIYISVYEKDEESYDIWVNEMEFPKKRIIKLGKDDNFWEVGTGPCGPCSEFYFDRGEEYGCGSPDCGVGCDCDRYMEFWNLVFTQYYKNEDGTYSELENKNIDTGMGLERIATIMQNVTSIFDVDTIKAIRDNICEVANVKYGENKKQDESIRIITDHVRSLTFMTSDGILPSNEGRGYVLRRLLRRAARHGKLLGIKGTFLADICKVVIEESKGAYPELLEKQDYIFKVISLEENKFYETLDQGMEILKSMIDDLKNKKLDTLNGEDAFKMYDTYGFPIDLMKEILLEENLKVDEDDFNKSMEMQKKRARDAREENSYMGAEETIYNKLDLKYSTEFIGYNNLSADNLIIKNIIAENELLDTVSKGNNVSIILDKTPVYAQSGGQVGDKAILTTDTGKVQIIDCIKVPGNKFAHIGNVVEGIISVGQKATVVVDEVARLNTARNHTATHLLQKALKDVLGNHIEQAGSYVSYDRLRFDFTHFAPLTNEEIKEVESIVNNKILLSLPVDISEKQLEDAKAMGAMALFGEKYGDIVRVINVAGYSLELCGGTHVKNTSQIGSFKIVSENGVASGVRRIEAVTGFGAIDFYNKQESILKDVNALLKSSNENVVTKLESFIMQNKELKSELEKLNSKIANSKVDDIMSQVTNINGKNVLLTKLENIDMNNLRSLCDKLKEQIKSGIILAISTENDKLNIVSMVTDDLIKEGFNAGNLVKEVALITGGKGGGRPNMAQAGGKDISKIDDAILKAKEIISNI